MFLLTVLVLIWYRLDASVIFPVEQGCFGEVPDGRSETSRAINATAALWRLEERLKQEEASELTRVLLA